MKSKKIVAMLLAAAMTAGCLIGCGQGTETNKESEKASETKVEESKEEVKKEPSLFNAPGTLPIVNEPVTLKILTQDQANNVHTGGETEKSKLWEWLEEKTGVHFEVESYPVEELKQKLPLIMSTPEEMPDMFWRCELAAADILSYGQNGQILMLDDLIAEYGPNIQYCFDNLEDSYGAAVAADGHIYSLPSYNATYAKVVSAMNQQFLDNIGMDCPTNFSELYDVFKAIKAHGDANGDGIKNNEIGWTGTMQTFRRGAMAWAGLNCYWPWNGIQFDNDGNEVFFVQTSDRYREMLIWLNKFYEEDMLDKEIFTMSNAELAAKRTANLAFVKNTCANPENNPKYEGPDGDFWPVPLTLNAGETPLVTLGANYQGDIGSISAYTKYPEVCMLVMDYLFSEEGSMVASMGMEGVDFTVTSEDPFIIERMDDTHNSGETYSEYAVLVPRWRRSEWVQPNNNKLNDYLDGLIKEYGKFSFQNYLKFSPEESDEIAVLKADLALFCDDYFVGFINGTYDIEKDWDAYVAECKKMKSEELTKIYQSGFNRYYGLD